jgi:hypothetical protein
VAGPKRAGAHTRSRLGRRSDDTGDSPGGHVLGEQAAKQTSLHDANLAFHKQEDSLEW